MDFHLWAVLLTVVCHCLFSRLTEFVNTGNQDTSLQIWYQAWMSIVVIIYHHPLSTLSKYNNNIHLCHNKGKFIAKQGEQGSEMCSEMQRVWARIAQHTPGEQWRNEQLPWWSGYSITELQGYGRASFSFLSGIPITHQNKYWIVKLLCPNICVNHIFCLYPAFLKYMKLC